MMATPFRVLVLMVAMRVASAYPYYWVDPQTNGDLNRAPPACTVHPSDSRHGDHPSVIPDSTVTILLQLGATPATSVCPGQSYTVTVSWPGAPRRSLATASYGQFTSTTPTGRNTAQYDYITGSNVPICPARTIGKPMPAFMDTLTLPCNATGELQVFVTSADGQTSSLRQTSATYPLDPTCAADACKPPPGVSPPPSLVPFPPSPSPPAPSPPAPPSPPPAPPGPPPAPAPTYALSAPSPASPIAKASLTCPASHLNYTCAQRFGGVTVHFSVGGPAPINTCTGADGGTLPVGMTSGAGLVHMAVEATTTGYVSLSFAQTANVMAPADAIVGWATPEGDVYAKTFILEYQDLTEANAKPWASFIGVMRASGNVTVCFTRPLAQPNASVSKNIVLGQDLTLNWATCPSAILKPHNAQGGGTLNLASGTVSEANSVKIERIRWHGALMATGWALLLPLGSLMPAHRWLFRDHKLGGGHVWFRLHVGLQSLGFAVMTAGFAIAWIYLDNPGETGGEIGTTHQILGTIVYALACVQLLAGFFRPSLDSPKRSLFNHGHRWVGRLTIICSWVVIYLGIYLFHTGIYKEKLGQWIVPVAISMGTILLVDVFLTAWAFKRGVRTTDSNRSANGSTYNTVWDRDARVEIVDMGMAVSKMPPGGRVSSV